MPQTERELSHKFPKIPSSFVAYFFYIVSLLKCIAYRKTCIKLINISISSL